MSQNERVEWKSTPDSYRFTSGTEQRHTLWDVINRYADRLALIKAGLFMGQCIECMWPFEPRREGSKLAVLQDATTLNPVTTTMNKYEHAEMKSVPVEFDRQLPHNLVLLVLEDATTVEIVATDQPER